MVFWESNGLLTCACACACAAEHVKPPKIMELSIQHIEIAWFH